MLPTIANFYTFANTSHKIIFPIDAHVIHHFKQMKTSLHNGANASYRLRHAHFRIQNLQKRKEKQATVKPRAI
jgi:hypothetical protein